MIAKLSEDERAMAIRQGKSFFVVCLKTFDNQSGLYRSVSRYSRNCISICSLVFRSRRTGKDSENNNICEVHECEVDLDKWREYLDELTIIPVDVATDPIINRHTEAIRSLSSGESMWEENADEKLKALADDCQQYIWPLEHHTQSTKAGVQDIAICSQKGRSEEDASTLSTICSLDLAPINRKLVRSTASS